MNNCNLWQIPVVLADPSILRRAVMEQLMVMVIPLSIKPHDITRPLVIFLKLDTHLSV